jgi:hypothetical protein
LHLTIQTVPPYVDYLYIRDGVRAAVHFATAPPHSEVALRRQILERVREREVSIPEQEIVTSVAAPRAYARLRWSVPVRVLWYTHVMWFTVEHSEPLR